MSNTKLAKLLPVSIPNIHRNISYDDKGNFTVDGDGKYCPYDFDYYHCGFDWSWFVKHDQIKKLILNNAVIETIDLTEELIDREVTESHDLNCIIWFLKRGVKVEFNNCSILKGKFAGSKMTGSFNTVNPIKN